MLKVLITAAVLSFSMFSFADDGDHTATVCSKLNTKVCAHLGHMTVLNSTNEVQFVAHFMTPQNQPISNLKVVLWMPDMGHGSSPVEISSSAVNKYLVKKAYFIMPGSWLVKMSFTYEQKTHEINIPVVVND